MKFHITLLSLLSSIPVFGQTAAEITRHNFTRLRTYTTSDGTRWRDETVYLDGLGRESEMVSTAFTPNCDLVNTLEYDSADVQSTRWLPVPCPQNRKGFYRAEEVAAARTEEYSDSRPFGRTFYEQSPLMRSVEQYGAGTEWHSGGKSIRTAYLGNTQNGDTRCGCYTATGAFGTPVITRRGNRYEGKLSVTKSTDEDGNATLEFTDCNGRILLHRRIGDGDFADTYYVYDDNGLLVAVLPPAASSEMDYDGTWTLASSEELQRYAYLYRYDYNLRCTAKKLPGCEWITVEYDRLDQPVFTQTGNQKARGEKSFEINDKFGRKVLSGTCLGNERYWEICHIHAERSTSSNALMGYDIKRLKMTSPTVTGAMYYDDYTALPARLRNVLGYEQTPLYGRTCADAKGKVTVSADAVLQSNGSVDNYVWTTYYYDTHDRLIQTASVLTDKSYDRTFYKYDFEGNVVQTLHRHGTSKIRIATSETTRYGYDNYGRLIVETHSINGGKETVLQRNSYDKLGRLSSTKRGSSDSLTVSYNYDIRNHVTKIGSDLFHERLYYNTAINGSTPLFNGRISAATAEFPIGMTTSPGQIAIQKSKSCNYKYDGFGRLAATHNAGGTFAADTGKDDCEYAYDVMGNLEHIKRNGQTGFNKYGTVDDITLQYEGNRIIKATNAADGSYFYNDMYYDDTADEPVEFDYDANGNLTRHADKGIKQIKYNTLNLPRMIEFCDGSTVGYTYTAGGSKLRADYTVVPYSVYMPNYEVAPNTDTIRVSRTYCGNHVYDGDSLTMVLVDGGYVTLRNNAPKYHFYIKDHLGSVRAVADENGNIEERDNYRPYGALAEGGVNTDRQPYKYCGKELDRMLTLDWLDHGARMYDPIVGRWWSVDPKAEEYYDVSPYVNCGDDTVNFTDYDGKKKHNWIKTDKSKDNDKSRENTAFHQERFTNSLIQIWAHGIVPQKGQPSTGIDVSVDYYYIEDGEYQHSVVPDVNKIKDAQLLYYYLNKYDKTWKESNNGKPIIILHCCATSDFAREISKSELFKNVTFIAPNATLVTRRHGNETIRNKIIKYADHTAKVNGHWDVFKNGSPILDRNGNAITYKFNAQPGTYGFNYGF